MKTKRQPSRRRRRSSSQLALFEWKADSDHGKALVVALEMFLDEHPAWAEGMDFLTTMGVQPDDAMLAVWYSLSKKDRGTREQLAQRLGVSRAVTYQWEDRHTYTIGGAVLTISDLGRLVRMRRVGTWVPDVEKRLYLNAVRADATASIIALALKYAGELKDELRLSGDEEKPLEIKVVGDYRAALAGLAPGSIPDRDAPGANQDAGDGTPVG